MADNGESKRSDATPATHYEVLGVERTADHDRIRRAYLSAARRWHPDRFGDASAAEAAEAEAAMRRVNEAWSVLGADERRRVYDQQLVVRRGGGDSGQSGASTSGQPSVTRIDPRLLDPEFLAARRDAQLNEISDRSAMAVRALPLILVLALMAGIFIFSAYATSRNDGPTTTTIPGPSLGADIEANDCVDIMSGPSLLEVPCGATADGQVIGAHLGDGSCPLGTTREVELSNGVWVCLA